MINAVEKRLLFSYYLTAKSATGGVIVRYLLFSTKDYTPIFSIAT